MGGGAKRGHGAGASERVVWGAGGGAGVAASQIRKTWGEGDLTRINDILANLMEAERRAGSGRQYHSKFQNRALRYPGLQQSESGHLQATCATDHGSSRREGCE